MAINKEKLIRLEKAGLLISQPFVEEHIAYPGGYIIGKPKSVGGNTRENYEGYWGEGIVCDAPPSYLFTKNNKYFFVVHQWIPGPGWGDFEKSYDDLEQAIQDIIDYYFGDPNIMNPSPLPAILSEDGKFCAKCGNKVLDITSNVPWEKAKEFLSVSNISDKEKLINSGFLASGVYCPLCGKLYKPYKGTVAKQIYEIYLISFGSNRQKLIIKFHQILNISLLEARNIINSNNKLIFTSDSFLDSEKVEFICKSLTSIGAKVKLRILTEKLGSSIDPYKIEDFWNFD